MTRAPRRDYREGLKPFQIATVEHAVRRLRATGGFRRFLVADEVGLGKTRVAKGVLEALCAQADLERPLNVFYVCSNLGIARQNADQLLRGYDTEQRARMRVEVDRLTLLPLATSRPTAEDPFRLYTLTTGTLPGSHRTGRVEERALLMVLIHELFPDFRSQLRKGGTLWSAMVNFASKSFERQYDQAAKSVEGRLTKLLGSFRSHLVRQLNILTEYEPLRPRAWDSTLVDRLSQCMAQDALATIGAMRIALCRAALEGLNADFIILDEFQNFFDLLGAADEPGGDSGETTSDRTAHQLMHELMAGGADADDQTSVLLLSATPYRLYGSWRSRDSGQHHHEFYKLLHFLFRAHGEAKVQVVRDLLGRYQRLLREAPPGSSEVLEVAGEIRRTLQEVMVRTERHSFGGGNGSIAPSVETCTLEPLDVFVFRHLHDAALDEHKCMAESFWSSIPYPLQMMPRSEYRFSQGIWEEEPPKPLRTEHARSAFIWRKNVRRYAELPAVHPRLRRLTCQVGDHLLQLPWLPPTLPWWQLGGCFAEAERAPGAPLSKVLVFSQYRAVPRALAASLSFRAEKLSFSADGQARAAYDYFARRDKPPKEGLLAQPAASFDLAGSEDQAERTISMFWPFPWLATAGDPTKLDGFAARALTFDGAKTQVASKLRALLPAIVSGARRASTWKVLAWLEAQNNQSFAHTLKQYEENAEKGMLAGLQSYQEAAGQEPVCTEETLDDLTELALAAPGSVFWRAARRVLYHDEQLTSWVGWVSGYSLRSYLDTPEFHVLLGRNRSRKHPAAVRRAVWEGNLESVLDEYLCACVGLGAVATAHDNEPVFERVQMALDVRAASLDVQHAGTGNVHNFRMRAHAALPLGLHLNDEGGGSKIRTDSLRHAFNSPFRPHVLVTTSVGQEGLDFHTYCNHIVHWDLPSNPVDLEQRDGRVNRYAGLSVRRQIAGQVAHRPLPTSTSPWRAIAAEQREAAQGLVPWWTTDGATTRRTVLALPLSSVRMELEELLAALSLYRLTLGQVDQERLLAALRRRVDATENDDRRRELMAWFDAARINLAPAVPDADGTMFGEPVPLPDAGS